VSGVPSTFTVCGRPAWTTPTAERSWPPATSARLKHCQNRRNCSIWVLADLAICAFQKFPAALCKNIPSTNRRNCRNLLPQGFWRFWRFWRYPALRKSRRFHLPPARLMAHFKLSDPPNTPLTHLFLTLFMKHIYRFLTL